MYEYCTSILFIINKPKTFYKLLKALYLRLLSDSVVVKQMLVLFYPDVNSFICCYCRSYYEYAICTSPSLDI